jgi:hypothetical protein
VIGAEDKAVGIDEEKAGRLHSGLGLSHG